MKVSSPLRRGVLAAASAAVCGAIALTAYPAGAATASTGSDAGLTQRPARPDHIFLIMMENHALRQVVGNPNAPYITALAHQYNLATNYHGVTHPSMPNYLATISGSFQGIWDDCAAGATVTCAPEEFVPDSGDGTDTASLTPQQQASASTTPHMFSGRTLVDQLEAHDLSWKAYMQSLPSAGSEVVAAPVVDGTTVKLYTQKHNPFMYFSRINSPGNPRLQKIVPFVGNFASDLERGTVPNFAWITPDQCHDMHGISTAAAALVNMPKCGSAQGWASGTDPGAIQMGDQFVKDTVQEITASRTWKTTNSSIVIVWDENDYSGYSGGPGSPVGQDNVVLGGGDAPLIVVNSRGTRGTEWNQPADHYTLLKTIETMWGLGCLENTCDAATSGTVLSLFH